jgi:protein-tyrosine sulfotransferase
MIKTTMDTKRLIFIGGSPRSGTTLVQNMLDSHPMVVGGPEFLHLPDIIGLRKRLHTSIGLKWIDLFCSKKSVDNHIVATVTDLFLPIAEKYGCHYYSEKTPENILVFSALIELFPEAHFIQVMRDPRAILSSMQQVKKKALAKGVEVPSFTVSSNASIVYIKRCYNAGRLAVQRYPDKVLSVVYEKLVTDPESEARKICRHIGLDWDDRMLQPGEKEHLGAKALTQNSSEIWYDSNSYASNVSTRNLEKWRTALPVYDQVRANMAFGEGGAFSSYGYDFTISGLARNDSFAEKVVVYGLYAYRKIRGLVFGFIRKIPGVSSIVGR